MRVAIVDDHSEDREALRALLERYSRQQEIVMDYVTFSSAEALLAVFAPGAFDLLFLDVYMTGITGMEAARQLTQQDPRCRMIFFTTSHAHAVESYEVRAAYYLTKPLDYPRLATAMEVACADLRRDSRALTLHCGGLPLVVRL
ncbi:MAG: response regulator, partial [Oscillospiraceae bacterium]